MGRVGEITIENFVQGESEATPSLSRHCIPHQQFLFLLIPSDDVSQVASLWFSLFLRELASAQFEGG
jgi:hypothetical protein